MTEEKMIVVDCPHCQQKVIWNKQNPFKPFCCERCKLIDLGEWAAEGRKIPGDPVSLESDSEYDPLLH